MTQTPETLSTTCPLDCPDACALGVRVVGGAIESIRGRQDHPDTAGFICGKVAGFHRRVNHSSRLLRPLRRVGRKGEGEFEPISWDAALAEIVERFRAIRETWGGEAIVPYHYGGSNGLLTDSLLDELFFAGLGASRLEKTICAAPTTAVALGMYGKMPGVAFEDYPRARCIVIWGANPKASNIHLVPYLKRAKRAGAFIAVVDPRCNFSDDEIDLHLPVRPGTDLAVALAMIGHWHRHGLLAEDFLADRALGLGPLLESAAEWSLARAAAEAGLSPGRIGELADAYAAASPALIRCGWGLERNRNGGQAVAAVLAMPALLGKFGVKGGGYTLSNSGASKFRRERLLGEPAADRRSLNMTQLGRWLNGETRPPVKGLFVYNANPVATVPDQRAILQGLAREDLFTVVFEQVMTDTARWADIVLPAVTFLEGRDLRAGYGSYVLGGVQPVIAPRGETRSNQQVFAALGRGLGLENPAFRWSEEELFARAVGAIELEGHKPEASVLMAGGNERHGFVGGTPIQFDSVLPRTADGKIHFTPAVLGPTPYRYLPRESRYPLALISPASAKLISSTLGEYSLDRLEVDLHPQDARKRRIASGDRVRVYNELGEVVCLARVTPEVRPGVVAMPKGAWRRSSLNGATVTALCPDGINQVAGGACFNDARVEIEAAPAE